VPAGEQWRLSGGLTYALSKAERIGFVLTYLDLGEAAIEGTTDVGTLEGDYSTNRAIFLGVNYGWE